MGHVIQAIITKSKISEKMSSELENVLVVDLPWGFKLIPMTMGLFEEIQEHAGKMGDSGSENDTLFLSSAVQHYLQRLSEFGDVMYLETDYFGGEGSQCAIMWRKGDVEFDLCFADTPEHPSPISRALKKMGVDATGYFDEFDALELHKYRHMESFECDD